MANVGALANAPSFFEVAMPSNPRYKQGQEEKFLKSISGWASELTSSIMEMQSSISLGYMVDEARFYNLTADTIWANNIITDILQLGDDTFELNGTTKLLTIKDENDTTRIQFGNNGASATDYGIRAWKSDGTLVFEVADAVYIDGVIVGAGTLLGSSLAGSTITGSKIASTTITNSNISNSTITGAKIASSTITNTNIANATITSAKIASLDADDINAGTITADGNPAIEITSAGAFVCSSGGDIILKSSGSNFNFIEFQNSSSTIQGQITQFGSAGLLVQGTATRDLYLDGLRLNIDAPLDTTQTFIESYVDINPVTDNADDLGSASRRWSLIRGVTITSGDIAFENNVIFTEPEKVWTAATMLMHNIDPDGGIVILTPDEVPQCMIGKNGVRTNLPPKEIDSTALKMMKSKPKSYEKVDGKWKQKFKMEGDKCICSKTGKEFDEYERLEIDLGRDLTPREIQQVSIKRGKTKNGVPLTDMQIEKIKNLRRLQDAN